ncbi:MAG: Omp28-related outer membrane protein [Ignavibacteriae bacterium]|nr:Omp28-related outer membrane protein [Ignavibacteriota bacterium]
MLRKFTYFIAALSLLFTTANSQAVKRVVLEQHTGAWCGWCVDGSYVVEQIHEKYPDNFIGVKIHNGDGMVIPEEDTLATDFNSHSYPQGSIDRFDWTGTGGVLIVERDTWMSKVETALAQEPEVDVNIVYTINEQTRELYATLTATMLESVNEELHFNCYIVEDSCSGTGDGWDQHNYLSGRAGYEDNPYYNLPDVIEGYQHMKVVRKMLGGAYGVKGEFAIPAEAGVSYSHNFSLALDPAWKINNIKILGLVQMYTSNKKTLNAAWGYVGEPKMPKFTVTSEQQETNKIAGKGESFDKTFTLKNISDGDVTYTLNAEKSARTPADWTADVELPSQVSGKTKINSASQEITLAPQQSSDFILKLTHGQTLGFGDATVTIGVKDDPEAIIGKRTITIISTEIQRFEVMDDGGETKYGLNSAIIQSGRNDFVIMSSNEFIDNKELFKNIKTIVWNCGLEGSLSDVELPLLKEMLDSGKRILLTGANIARSTGGANIEFFNGLKGIAVDYFKDIEIGASGEDFVLAGTQNDPITNNFEQTCKINKYKTPCLMISNMTKAFPILYHKDNIDSIVAIRYSFQGKRVVYMPILPEIIKDETARNNLIGNSLNWLETPSGVDDNTAGGVMNVQASPNPVNNKTNIQYNLGGDKSMFAEMFLVDLNGRKVATIMKGTLAPGEYSCEFDASAYPSGSYYIVTWINDGRVITPVAIVR